MNPDEHGCENLQAGCPHPEKRHVAGGSRVLHYPGIEDCPCRSRPISGRKGIFSRDVDIPPTSHKPQAVGQGLDTESHRRGRGVRREAPSGSDAAAFWATAPRPLGSGPPTPHTLFPASHLRVLCVLCGEPRLALGCTSRGLPAPSTAHRAPVFSPLPPPSVLRPPPSVLCPPPSSSSLPPADCRLPTSSFLPGS